MKTKTKTIPLVSVVMPAYNAEKYISDAIESILTQSYRDYEFIIVNDASTDSTQAICQRYSNLDKRIKIITNKTNLNIGASLNKGIINAKGKYIARMDADDISLTHRLSLQTDYLEKKPDVAVVGGNIILIEENGTILHTRRYETRSKFMKQKIFRFSPFAHPATMFRKSAFDEFGGYDPSKSPSEDLDLWIKIGTKYDFGSIDEPILKYRTYTTSSSNKKLRNVEINTIKMRWEATFQYGYRPTISDILINVVQYLTLWFFPAKTRIRVFNSLRAHIK